MSTLKICKLPSSFFDEREPPIEIDTIIIHSMYNPESADPLDPVSCKQCLDSYGVSAHYLIDTIGRVWNTVAEDKRAWHAGPSRMPTDGREGINHFSIGIELIALRQSGFTDAQYRSLAELTCEIATRHPLRHILGHGHIAPERKDDPWNFDWERFLRDLTALGIDTDSMEFPKQNSSK